MLIHRLFGLSSSLRRRFGYQPSRRRNRRRICDGTLCGQAERLENRVLLSRANLTPITIEADSFDTSISDDGTQVAFASTGDFAGLNADGSFEVFVFDTTTGEFEQITNSADRPGDPRRAFFVKISGDGNRVLYELADRLPDLSFDLEVFLFDRTTRETIVVPTDNNFFGDNADLNTDGTRVVYSIFRDLTGENPDLSQELFLFDTIEDSVTQLTFSEDDFGGVSTPRISGDGTRIAFFADFDLTGGNPDENDDIYLIDLNEDSVVQLTNSDSVVSFFSNELAFSTDGTTLAFVSRLDLTGQNSDEQYETFLLDVDTQQFQQITFTDEFGIISRDLSINADGTRLGLETTGDFAGFNPDMGEEVFVYDVLTETFIQLTNRLEIPFNNGSIDLDASGERIVFLTGEDQQGTSIPNTFNVILTTFSDDPLSCLEPQQVAPAAINGSYTQVVGGNFVGSEAGDQREDLFFWNPQTGANRIVAADGTIHDNPIDALFINGNDFLELLAGDLDGIGLDDILFWNPSTGRNRIAHFTPNETVPEPEVSIQSNPINPLAINGNDFESVVSGNVDGSGAHDLFFWAPQSGRNRLVRLEASAGEPMTSVLGIENEIVPATAINGDFTEIRTGNFVDGGLDELIFLNLETGRNRQIELALDDTTMDVGFSGLQTNLIAPAAINGNASGDVAVADFDDNGIDDFYVWNPTTGANRLVLRQDEPGMATTIVDHPTDPLLINSNKFSVLLPGTFLEASSPTGSVVFFWDPQSGANATAFNP